MASSNITVTHAETGVVTAEVVDAQRISPHFVRLTVAGPELANWRDLGFDQWFRLAVPTSEATRFDNLADTFDTAGYLRYLTLPRATRPVIRNYTVRAFRAELRELDIDFVVHGDEGVAGPWAGGLPVGASVGLIDQGCGYAHAEADHTLLVGDESALPAVVGILRDLPRDARGHAIVEIADLDDRQEVDGPDGVEVHWVVREPGRRIGEAALQHLIDLPPLDGTVSAFAAGESKLATGARRHLVNERGVPKASVTFCGYWRAR
ncbi:siderophore-interacting protein [Agromyces aerolatus]|uniref:siderophore-interacting protein n=1 Tax=Agromyces sp. LY-1074 TaxID=3074080 RepID=UPI002864B94D|nr:MULTISPECIES: siderophore-interacting protein [unclassified Agromyces]MDR5699655.1 siderophore-interacting protein [Agromyces sp. LY-1074]MDR5705951.1 siderophore-interacting protein [Agromyces sp. LY-1358]